MGYIEKAIAMCEPAPSDEKVAEALADFDSLMTHFLKGDMTIDDAKFFMQQHRHAVRARLQSGQSEGVEQWKNDPPQDGTKFYGRYVTPFRWQKYSPKSSQFKNGVTGRWQMMNEYGGWGNTEYLPDDWITHADYTALQLERQKRKG